MTSASASDSTGRSRRRSASSSPKSREGLSLHLFVVRLFLRSRSCLTPLFSTRARRAGVLILLRRHLGLFASVVATQGPRFYPDDPIAREPESQDASKAAPYDLGQIYELLYNLFVTSGYKPSGLRAKNINTIDEVPDSSWFTNRIGTRAVTTDELTKGANVGGPPDPSKWVLIREKTSGAHPGFTALDAKGDTWFLEFDPPKFAEGATGAVAIATKIFWALGYNQVESFLTTFDPKNASIDPEGYGQAAVRRAKRVHRRRHERDPRDRVRAMPTAPIASSQAGCFPARFSAASCTPGRGPTIPTISCRTNIGVNCGPCASLVRGRTSPTSRWRTRSTR